MEQHHGFFCDLSRDELRDLLEGIVANSPVAIMVTDAQGRVIAVNRAHTELTGLTFDKLVKELRLNFREYLRVVNRDAYEALERAFKGESIELPEFFYRVVPGPGVPVLSEKLVKGFWIHSKAFPIYDEQGQFKYVVVMNEDITSRKELEALLMQAQKMETIGTLAGGVAHDFNNILAGITGYASMLVNSLPLGSPEREAAQVILESADKGASLTEQLLTIARRNVTALETQDIKEWLPDTIQFLRRSIGPRHPIVLEAEEGEFLVESDKAQLEQAITNLCINARDAMPKGGRILVRLVRKSYTSVAEVPLANMPPGDYARIEVTDEGVGIPPDLVSRIFEPFFTTKELGMGTGLGLALVYGIAKSHRGFIDVRSKPGEGSSFMIYLPMSRAQKVGKSAENEAREEVLHPASKHGIEDTGLEEAQLKSVSRKALGLGG